MVRFAAPRSEGASVERVGTLQDRRIEDRACLGAWYLSFSQLVDSDVERGC